MTTISASFTAVGAGAHLAVKRGDSFSYAVSGTFVATVLLERSVTAGAAWSTVVTATAAASGTVIVEDSAKADVWYRFRCSAFTSGTAVTSIADVSTVSRTLYDRLGAPVFQITDGGVIFPGTSQAVGALTADSSVIRTSRSITTPAGSFGKVGAVAGWVVAVADNVNLATLPASQTSSVLILPVTGLKVGDTITGYHLVGQIESAGNTATLGVDFRRQTAAAGDVQDSNLGSLSPTLSVTADTKVDISNTEVTLATPQVVAQDQTFYAVIIGTTAASTDIALQGLAVIITEA